MYSFLVRSAVEVKLVRTGREVDELAWDGAILGEIDASGPRKAGLHVFCALLVNSSR